MFDRQTKLLLKYETISASSSVLFRLGTVSVVLNFGDAVVPGETAFLVKRLPLRVDLARLDCFDLDDILTDLGAGSRKGLENGSKRI